MFEIDGPSEEIDLQIPNPGRVTKGNGFTVTSRIQSKDGLQVRLDQFFSQRRETLSYVSIPPAPPTLTQQLISAPDTVYAWLFGPGSSYHWTAEGILNVSDPSWVVETTEASPNYGDLIAAQSTSTAHPVWNEPLFDCDGPYKLEVLTLHEKLIAPSELEQVTIPKAGEELPLHKRYVFGKAWVELESIRGPTPSQASPTSVSISCLSR